MGIQRERKEEKRERRKDEERDGGREADTKEGREEAEDSLRTGSRRTRLAVFGNGEHNFVAENCY